MHARRKKRVRLFVVGAIVLGIALAGDAGVMGAGLLKGPAVTALIEVSMRDDVPVFSENINYLQREYQVFKATQAQLLKSPFVLMTALRKPGIGALEIVRRESANPITWLQNNLKVSFLGDGSIMAVSLADRNTDEAAKLVNAIVEAYLTEVVEHGRKTQQRKLADLDKVLSRKEQEIRARRTTLKRLAEELGMADRQTLAHRVTFALRELALYQKELLRKQLELVEARVRLKAKQAILAETAKEETANSKSSAPAKAEPEIRKQVELKSDIEERKLQIAVLSAQVDFLTEGIAERREQAERIGRSTVELDMMRAELDNLEASRKTIATKREALEVEFNSRPRIRPRQMAEAQRQPPKSPAAEAK